MRNFILGLCSAYMLLCTAIPSAYAAAPEGLFYITNTANGLASFREHAKQISIIAPQTYAAAADGTLLGAPNPQILQIAQSNKVAVMPLVCNQYFSQATIDSLLASTTAQEKLISALLNEGLKEHYLGFQYDFEHIPATDSAEYSAFVRTSAQSFETVGLKLSIAVAAQISDNPNDYAPGVWANWIGAYNYAALGQSADFLSVMAYDDSASGGPSAPLPWVSQVLAYALGHVPAQKLSLGIPLYSWVDWPNGKLDYTVTYPKIAVLRATQYLSSGWSETFDVPWVTYKKDGVTLTAWYENKQSFTEKMNLVNSNHLYGFSAWALGQEDPGIWNANW